MLLHLTVPFSLLKPPIRLDVACSLYNHRSSLVAGLGYVNRSGGNAVPSHQHDDKNRGYIFLILWWSQLSRQCAGKNKIKLNRSRCTVLAAGIDERWRLIVQRLMQTLVIVKGEVRA